MTMHQIDRDLWQINEANDNGPYVDAYLLIGREGALLIDSLMQERNLYNAVRELTDLPLTVVVTHAHGDHAGKGLAAFHERGVPIHLSPADEAYLWDHTPAAWFSPVQDRYELGGLSIEVLGVGGHTPGSLVLYDRAGKRLFSGDSIGSGHFWMQIPGALPLDKYLVNVDGLMGWIGDMDGLLVYPGHRAQSPVQLDGQYLRDVREITQGILQGRMKGEEAELTLMGRTIRYRSVSYGLMSAYCYHPDNLH